MNPQSLASLRRCVATGENHGCQWKVFQAVKEGTNGLVVGGFAIEADYEVPILLDCAACGFQRTWFSGHFYGI
jgi:hypothetical protein